MRIEVVTLFPELIRSALTAGVLGRAVQRGLIEVGTEDPRAHTHDVHRTVDDRPYGGGPGMVMKPEPLVAAIEALAGPKREGRTARVVLLSPQGRRFDQAAAEELAARPHLVLVCGRYEGVDQRVIDLGVDEEISIGDYVLAGGELPALVVIEAVARLIPGVMGNPASAETESFRGGLLEAPHYTRPAEFRGLEVPEVLRSGDHQAIARWRAEQARERTRRRRPDLLRAAPGEDER
jgi:tRNA (guanine37-N1)-methyltransferase